MYLAMKKHNLKRWKICTGTCVGDKYLSTMCRNK